MIMTKHIGVCALLVASASLGSCATTPGVGESPGRNQTKVTWKPASLDDDSAGCPVVEGVAASYVGPYYGMENALTPEAMARDIYCANEFTSYKFPKGFVTIYGSSRIRETNATGNPDIDAENSRLYGQVKDFAFTWTKRFGSTYPIMTGAAPA